jgi:hypothetical protein
MYIQHARDLLAHPRHGWRTIKDERTSLARICCKRLAILAAIPALSLFCGLTLIGWSLSGKEFHIFDIDKAFLLAFGFYCSMIIGALSMAYFVFWLEKTYGGKAKFEHCVNFITYTALPMYLCGLVAVIPIVWLVVLTIFTGMIYSLYLLYVGIPIFMNIPEGKGFMFSTAIIMAGLCTLVSWITLSTVLFSGTIMI